MSKGYWHDWDIGFDVGWFDAAEAADSPYAGEEPEADSDTATAKMYHEGHEAGVKGYVESHTNDFDAVNDVLGFSESNADGSLADWVYEGVEP